MGALIVHPGTVPDLTYRNGSHVRAAIHISGGNPNSRRMAGIIIAFKPNPKDIAYRALLERELGELLTILES